MKTRDQQIIHVSIIGIGTNILLALFKATVGLLANSIAILLDSVNNFSDALSSVITIVGTKLAAKSANKKHPFGYGRIEYMTTIIISCIVLFAGISSLVESVKHVIHPKIANYSGVTLFVIGVAVIVKLWLGYYVRKKGTQLNADMLLASASDAILDAMISVTTILGALVTIFFKISIDGFLGAIISIIIMKAGFEMLFGALANILGQRIDSQLAYNIKKDVISYEDVQGAYDLLLHSYGPERMMGSLHIEVNDYMTAKEIQEISRKIQTDIYGKYGCFLTIGIYAVNTSNDYIAKLQNDIESIVHMREGVLQIHGFYVNMERKQISFDIIFDFVVKDAMILREHIKKELNVKYPEYHFEIQIDRDYSD